MLRSFSYQLRIRTFSHLGLHTTQSADAFRPGHVTKTHSCGWIREVPENLRNIRYLRPVIPFFYKKYTEAYGIPVVGEYLFSAKEYEISDEKERFLPHSQHRLIQPLLIRSTRLIRPCHLDTDTFQTHSISLPNSTPR